MKHLNSILIKVLIIACCSYNIVNAQSCILLGNKPSFIITPAQKNKNLTATNTLQTLSTLAQLDFTAARPMALGQYILNFTPPKANTACYSTEYINAIIQRLKKSPLIAHVEPNILLKLDEMTTMSNAEVPTPSSNQWNLGTDTSSGGMDAPGAWAVTTGSPNALVAVLDNGVMTNLSLSPNVDTNNAASFYNNGHFKASAASECPTCDGSGHGTHTAGSVASSGNGSYGQAVYGLAYTAKVLPVNVFSKFTNSVSCAPDEPPCLLAYTSDIANGLAWLAGTSFLGLGDAPSVVAVNMSLGGGGDCGFSIQTPLTNLYNDNITVIVSAGNADTDARFVTPANCEHVVAVAATGKTNQKAYYSNYGSTVSIAAPGGDFSIGTSPNGILSTVDGGYNYYQGTSMAAPQVAGLAALLYSVDPTISATQVLADMQSTATAFATGSVSRSCSAPTTCGAGIINASAAVALANTQKSTIEWTPDFVVNTQDDDSVLISWNAATWSNAATTPIRYTVKLNGVTYASCHAILATSCIVTNLFNAVVGDVPFTVEASDGREIYSPDVQTGNIDTALIAPTLTEATRDNQDISKAYVSYSTPGTLDDFVSYKVNGLSNVTVTLDSANSRFILSNISHAEATNISITGVVSEQKKASSNTINLPKVILRAPVLTSAKRNPMLLSQAWIYYNNPTAFDASNQFSISQLAGSRVVIDPANQRFIVDNISTGKATNITVTEKDAFNDSVESNVINLPGVLSNESH
jgi:subtilisin family serine protease